MTATNAELKPYVGMLARRRHVIRPAVLLATCMLAAATATVSRADAIPPVFFPLAPECPVYASVIIGDDSLTHAAGNLFDWTGCGGWSVDAVPFGSLEQIFPGEIPDRGWRALASAIDWPGMQVDMDDNVIAAAGRRRVGNAVPAMAALGLLMLAAWRW